MDIVLQNISKSYGGKVVLNGFHHTFLEGTTTCILGESGCGKTTLLRILMGLECKDSGEIHGLASLKCSSVFQEDRLISHLSSIANVKLVCNAEIPVKTIETTLMMVGLNEAMRQMVSTLSGGMKRRVAIVRALLSDYDILCLDEPFKGLDEETKRMVMRVVKDLSYGKTVIMVTHDKKEAEFMEGELLVMSSSRK